MQEYKNINECIRFPYNIPLPITLITKIIKFRTKGVLVEQAKKTKSRPKSKLPV